MPDNGYDHTYANGGDTCFSAPHRAEHHPLPWPHALVIDDDRDILDVYGLFLADEGFATTLSSAPVNVEDIVKLAPDIVLFDAMFHRADFGTEFVDHCRADHRLYDLPMLCCTASRTVGSHLEILQVPTVLKPFDLDTLLEAMRQTMRPAPVTRRPVRHKFDGREQDVWIG